jgi:hypothetical protein
LLKGWESGSAEYTSDYRRRWEGNEDGEDRSAFEVIEVLDGGRTLSDWRRPDGAASDLGELPIVRGEVSPPDVLEDMEPDEEHFREATGNEGASFERTYSRAALVLWPSARILAILNQAGVQATLPYLGTLIAKWQVAGAAEEPPLRKEAVALAGHMLTTWTSRRWQTWDNDRRTGAGLAGQPR